MPFLTPDCVWSFSVCGVMLDVNERIVPDCARAPRQIAAHVPKGGRMKPNAPLGGNGRARGITVHNTNDITTPAGTNPAEQYSRATWPNANMRGVVVHFYVWRREIWQILSLSEQGWHASDGAARRASNQPGQSIGGNLDTIAIEVIGNHPQTEQTAAMLCAYLLHDKGLDARTDLYTHNFFMGRPDRIVQGASKNCPLYILPRWEGFKSRVRGYYDSLGCGAPLAIGDTVLFSGGPVYPSSDSSHGRERASAVCTVTRIARGAARPYHLESLSPGIVFGWVDASNVARESSPARPEDASRELELLRTEHEQLRGELQTLARRWQVNNY